jgi:[protein-PII] uridylyltransferase
MPIDDRPPLPARIDDPAALAEWLETERDRCIAAARAEPRAGRVAARALAGSVDALAAAAATKLLPAGGGWALVATGDWGCGELAPASPLSAWMIHTDQASPTEETSRLIALLRGAGASVEIRLSAAGKARDWASGDSANAVGLLGARAVAGAGELWTGLREAFEDRLRQSPRGAVDAVVTPVLARHAAGEGSVCRVEPDLSLNPGGLEDLRARGFVGAVLALATPGELRPGRGLLEEEDFEDLEGAGSFLWGCRAVLHGLAGSDRLERAEQARLAAALGYRSADQVDAAALLMRDVLGTMRTVQRIVRVAVAQQEEERSWGERRKTVDRRRKLSPDFVRIGKRIYLARPDLFEGRGAALRMMEGFSRAAAARLGFSQEFLKRVRDNLYMVGDEVRESADAAAAFREILASRGGAADVLRAMHESGFLGAYLPEFTAIDCLVTGEPDQDFTVDEHTLRAVVELDRIETGGQPGAERAAELASALPGWLLKLAALVHALGQSRGATGFPSRSAEMVPRIAGQLRLAEPEARLLVFLTEQQLLLPEAAASRMTTDEQLLAELAETIGGSDRLDALYVLSAADLAALGPDPAGTLRPQQLAALYERLAARLAARPGRTRGGLAEEAAELLPAGFSRADLDRHLELVPERYLLEVSPEDAALHVRLLADIAGPDAVAVDWSRRKLHVHFWVLGPDRPRRISQIAGAMLCARASIVSARAYTRSDGVIIDRFDLVPAPSAIDAGQPAEGTDQFWNSAAETIREVLSSDERLGGRSRLAVLLDGALSGASAGGTGGSSAEIRVTFDNRVSADYTVIDVQCPDRVGLLYALSAGLSDAGADIVFAKINTVGGVAQDVFYITVGGAKVEDREAQRRIRAAIGAELRSLSG